MAERDEKRPMANGSALRTDDVTVERGSGNVFADLGRPDAEARLLKAELVTRIDEIIRGRRLTQARAAELLGLSQPDVSRLLRGDFRDVDIVIRKPRSGRHGD